MDGVRFRRQGGPPLGEAPSRWLREAVHPHDHQCYLDIPHVNGYDLLLQICPCLLPAAHAASDSFHMMASACVAVHVAPTDQIGTLLADRLALAVERNASSFLGQSEKAM